MKFVGIFFQVCLFYPGIPEQELSMFYARKLNLGTRKIWDHENFLTYANS